jgi:hypothetical protein
LREIGRLQDLIAELKAAPPRIVVQEKIVTKEIVRNFRIGSRVERIMEMYEQKQHEIQRRLAQNMLFYHAKAKYWEKRAQEQSNIPPEIRGEGDDQSKT